MKNKNQNRPAKSGKSKNKSLGEFTRQSGEHTKGLGELTNRAGELTSRSGELTKRSGGLTSRSGELTKRAGELTKVPGERNPAVILMNIVLLALKTSNLDYIPHSDGAFDEWQKNYVKHLSSAWPPPEEGTPAPAPAAAVVLLYEFLGIPKDRYEELIDMQKLWTKDFARGGKKTDRRSSETVAKQETREKYETMLRKLSKQYILYNDKTTNEIKRALKLTVPDTEPSTVHGSHLTTLAPVVFLKNMGGAKIDVRFSRPEDDNRSNVPKGFDAELRYVLEIPLPPDPEDIPTKTTVISSKARFQIEAGMTNKKKTLRSYARWRHRKNPAFHSPWTTVMEIDIV